MKFLIQLMQLVFIAIAVYCIVIGVAMVPAICLLLIAIWMQLVLIRMTIEERAP